MSVGLPPTATCKLLGHAWMPRPVYAGPPNDAASGGTHRQDNGVCARCGATNEAATNVGLYQPRHLRPRP